MSSLSLDSLGGRTAVLADVCLVALLAGAIGLGSRPGEAYLTVACGLILLSFIPSLSRTPVGESLPWDQRLVVVAVLLLLADLRIEIAGGVAGWWALIPSALLGLSGVVLTLVSRRPGEGSAGRFGLVAAVGVALVAAVGMVLVVRGVLSLRSTAEMTPGRIDFLDELACWAAIWLGLDSRLRWEGGELRPGLAAWSWRHGHGLAAGLVVALGLILLAAA